MNRKWVIEALTLIGWASEWGPTVNDGLLIAPIAPGPCPRYSLDWGRTFVAFWRDGRVVLEALWGEVVPLAELNLPPEAARELASALFDASIRGRP